MRGRENKRDGKKKENRYEAIGKERNRNYIIGVVEIGKKTVI